jgi:hypothetical protein
MPSDFAHCSLLLCPVDASAGIESLDAFASRLVNIGLIAHQIDGQQNRYYVGENYLGLISYMGCAPSIQFQPTEDSSRFCHVQIHQYDRPVLKYNQKPARNPRCPVCGQSLKNWSFDDQEPEATTLACPLCGHRSGTETYGWQKMAGFARLFIEITDIFPKEAIPQPELLMQLEQLCGFGWQYFYYCHESHQ